MVVTLGSLGDVHPFVGVAQALQRRGHRVTLLTNGYLESLVRAAGLDFHSIGRAQDYERTTADADLWSPTKGMEVFWRNLGAPAMKPTYEFIRDVAGSEKCTVVASPFAFGARLAQEKLGIPLITGYLQPAIIRTCHGPLVIAGANIPSGLSLRRWLWRAIDWLILDRLFCPSLNALRRELGLGPVKQVFGQWMHSPRRGVALFPEWFAPPRPDWPPQVVMTGFPLFDEAPAHAAHPELERFLAQGDPPIVFTPGSAMRHGAKFFQVSMQACATLGHRAIFLSQYRDQIPRSLPPGIRHFDYVPFSRLLNRAAALVHHGGIGSCAQAMQAGIPQLVMPMAHDQFDNALRIQELGIGDSVPQKSYRMPLVAKKLARLTRAEEIKARCHVLAKRFLTVDVLGQVCAAIEAV